MTWLGRLCMCSINIIMNLIIIFKLLILTILIPSNLLVSSLTCECGATSNRGRKLDDGSFQRVKKIMSEIERQGGVDPTIAFPTSFPCLPKMGKRTCDDHHKIPLSKPKGRIFNHTCVKVTDMKRGFSFRGCALTLRNFIPYCRKESAKVTWDSNDMPHSRTELLDLCVCSNGDKCNAASSLFYGPLLHTFVYSLSIALLCRYSN